MVDRMYMDAIGLGETALDEKETESEEDDDEFDLHRTLHEDDERK